MKTYPVILASLLMFTQYDMVSAQKSQTDPPSRSEMVDQNYIFQLTRGIPEHRSAYVMSALQYYVDKPADRREAIVRKFDELIRNDTSMSVRYSALVASAVLKDSALSRACRRWTTDDLPTFSGKVMREAGIHLSTRPNASDH